MQQQQRQQTDTNLENAVFNAQKGDIERSATKVEDEDGLAALCM